MPYSIIIPIYNEVNTLKRLLNELKKYISHKHEIIIVDDGSTDNSMEFLKKTDFIKLISLKKNLGKGNAIRVGLQNSMFSKIIIYDGDLELKTLDINKLMILNKSIGVYCALGTRYQKLQPFKSLIEWGNFIFTSFFNLTFMTRHKDILCGAKSFYLEDIYISKIKSLSFDIDIELTVFLTKNSRKKKIKHVLINYNRRSFDRGKKLKITDGFLILKRIILNIFF